MRFQKKQLLILAGFLVFAIAILIAALTAGKASETDASSQDTEELTLFTLDREIRSIEVSGKQTYRIEQAGDGTYYVTDLSSEQSADAVDSQKVSDEKMAQIIQVLEKITTKTVIENVTDFEEFGLKNPLLSIRIDTDSSAGDAFLIEIGSFSRAASMYYARFNSENRVCLMTTLVEIAFDFSPEDLSK